MFTGLIEEVGKVLRLEDAPGGARRLTIGARQVTRELKKGDSVAVSGVCLTAVDIAPASFAADLAAETIARTSFTRLRPDALVNLELPAKVGSRLGGHIVQGHVDGTARLVTLERVPKAHDYWLTVEIPAGLAKYVVWKGSITIEGISLTVARIDGARVGVAIIPHTFSATNLQSLRPGDALNIEVDVIAKYTEKMLRGEPASGVTLERLVSEGF
ncbi:MAG TPA: riboflavin synthase [Terriglobales bacterium]|nr:riboflavin synthase [Terriglobales bacterium]